MSRIAIMGLEEWQKEYFSKRILDQEATFHEDNIVINDDTKNSEIIACFIFGIFDKKTLQKFPNLKLITTMSAGYDHIDLDYCKEKGIVVCNVPKYGDHTVAELAFGLILNLSRKLYEARERSKKGNLDFKGLLGFDLKGKTIGVIGTGNIGQISMEIAKGFDMKVIAYDAYPREELQEKIGFEYVSLEELLKRSDVVTIHVPFNKHTLHLIGKEEFEKMKPGGLLINTSRGEIIETQALVDALKSKKLGGAGLDVLEGERMLKTKTKNFNKAEKQQKKWFDELRKMDNVFITPHQAFYSKEALIRIMDTTLVNIYDYIENRGFNNQITN